jgi:hypothetical protein
MVKNKITQIDIYKRLRKTWEINPSEQVVPNKKKKNRQKQKLELKKELDNEI